MVFFGRVGLGWVGLVGGWVSKVVVVVVVLLGVFVEKKGRTLRWMKLSLMSSSVSGSFSGRGSGGGESRIL